MSREEAVSRSVCVCVCVSDTDKQRETSQIGVRAALGVATAVAASWATRRPSLGAPSTRNGTRQMVYSIFLLKVTIVYTISVHHSESKLYFSEENEETSIISLVNGIQQIIDNYFTENLYLIIFDRDNTSRVIDYVSNYLHNINTPLVSTENITQEEFTQGDFCWTNDNWFSRNSWCGLKRIDNLENSVGFVIARSIIDNKCFLDVDWKMSSFWNPRSFFLIVITTPVTEGKTILAEAIKDCWDKLKILNVVVIFRSILEYKNKYPYHYSTRNSKLSIRTISYNPFSGIALEFSPFNNVRNGNNIFPNKLKDTRGFFIDVFISHPTHVLLIEKVDHDGNIVLEGPNGKMINEVARAMNLTLNITPYEDFENDDKGAILTSEMAGIQAIQEGIQPFNLRRSTYPFDQDCITLIVPKALEIPRYLKIILPFTLTVWLLLVTTNVSVSLIWKIVTVFDEIENSIKLSKNVFINVFRMSVGSAPDYLPSLFPQRFIVIMLLIFNLIINSAYTGSLNSCLIKVKYLPDVNNLMESLDSDMKIGVIMTLSKISDILETIDLNDPYILKTMSKLCIMKSDEEILDMISNHRNLTQITLKFFGKFLINNPIYFKNGHPMMHVVEECFTYIWHGFMTLENHSPFLSALSFFVTRLNECGFCGKWKSDFLNQAPRIRINTEPIILTKDHLQAAFFLLLIGLCVGCVVFFVEKIICNNKNIFGLIYKNSKHISTIILKYFRPNLE